MKVSWIDESWFHEDNKQAKDGCLKNATGTNAQTELG